MSLRIWRLHHEKMKKVKIKRMLDIIERGFDRWRVKWVELSLLTMDMNVVLNVASYYHVHHLYRVYLDLPYVFDFSNIFSMKNLNVSGIERIHIG